MGKGGGSAPENDPRVGEAALLEAKTGQDWLKFATEQFEVSKPRQAALDKLTASVTKQQMGLAQRQMDFTESTTRDQLKLATGAQAQATKISDAQLKESERLTRIAIADRKRYEKELRPLEDAYIKEASNYGSKAKQGEAAAEARSDVMKSAASAKGIRNRELASMGVNPMSGRFAGIQAETEMDTAIAAAGASNTARKGVRDQGLALKADLANMARGGTAAAAAGAGQGLAASGQAASTGLGGAGVRLDAGQNAIGSAGQAAQLGISAGNSAMGALSDANKLWMASTAIPGAGYQGAMSGYSGMANTLNNQYSNELQKWKIEQDNASAGWAGIGSALGSIAGMFSFASDEELKEDKVPVEEGAALAAVESMPVEEWTYKEGAGDGGRHVGPYAQDFAAATGKGDGKSINVIDAIGVTMGAVKDLSAKVDTLAGQIGLGAAAPKPKVPAQPNPKKVPAAQPASHPAKPNAVAKPSAPKKAA